MRVRRAGLAMSAIALACVSALLAGCASSSPPPQSPPPTFATKAPVRAPSASPTAAENILFTIGANVRGTDNSTIGIQLVAHSPVAYGDQKALPLATDFLANCSASTDGPAITDASLAQSGSTLMKLDLTSNRPGRTFAAPIELSLGNSNFPRTATGRSVTAASTSSGCYGPYYWGTSDNAQGIANFQNPDAAVPDREQWRYGRYGFLVAPTSGTTIEACTVTITALGEAAGLSRIAGWDPATAATGTSCMIGYAGE